MLEFSEEAFEGFGALRSFKANSYRIFGWPWSIRNNGFGIWTHSFEDLIKFEPLHKKTYKMTCAPSEDSYQPYHCLSFYFSYQPGHSPSIISLRCPHEESFGPYLPIERTAKWADTQADLSLRWVHRPFCWFWHEAAHFKNLWTLFISL